MNLGENLLDLIAITIAYGCIGFSDISFPTDIEEAVHIATSHGLKYTTYDGCGYWCDLINVECSDIIEMKFPTSCGNVIGLAPCMFEWDHELIIKFINLIFEQGEYFCTVELSNDIIKLLSVVKYECITKYISDDFVTLTI
jgi:hypothetical protein